jgi:hypothetical protein
MAGSSMGERLACGRRLFDSFPANMGLCPKRAARALRHTSLLRLTVRTLGCGPGNDGSIPPGGFRVLPALSGMWSSSSVLPALSGMWSSSSVLPALSGIQTHSSVVEQPSNKRQVRGSIPFGSIRPEHDVKLFAAQWVDTAGWRSGSVPGS